MASRSVVSLEHVPTEDAGDPADSPRPPSVPPFVPSEWPNHTPETSSRVLSKVPSRPSVATQDAGTTQAPLTEEGRVQSKINIPVVIGAVVLVVGIAVLVLTSWAPRWVIAVMALVYIAVFFWALSVSSSQFRNAIFPLRR